MRIPLPKTKQISRERKAHPFPAQIGLQTLELMQASIFHSMVMDEAAGQRVRQEGGVEEVKTYAGPTLDNRDLITVDIHINIDFVTYDFVEKFLSEKLRQLINKEIEYSSSSILVEFLNDLGKSGHRNLDSKLRLS